jgi:hypothetical protein
VGGTPLTLTATFKTQYQLTDSVLPLGGGTVTPASGFFDAASAVPLTATANSGFVFSSWSGSVANATSASTSVTMTGPETVTANFVVGGTSVTIQTVPAGQQFMVDMGAAQTAPQTLSLTAGPHTITVAVTQAGGTGIQYVFSTWSDNGAASHTITVGAAAATYTATFKTQYELTISASPAGSGTVTPATGAFYDSGASVAISATPTGGSSFTNWSGPAANPTSASTTVTMSGPLTVTANFSGGAAHPAFFAGEAALSNGVYYLQFPNGNLFGYYTYNFFPFLFHFDLGFEYFLDAGNGGAYLYDFASGHWFYTSPTYGFPYMFDLTLINPKNTNCPNAAAMGGCPGVPIYYFPDPDPKNPGHYSTNPRYFLNILTGAIFTM